jgi:TPR repeat protein
MKEDQIKSLSSTLLSQQQQQQQKSTIIKKQISIKDSNPLHPKNDLNIRSNTIAPNVNHPLLLGESHLGLALRDIPFELHDTQSYYGDISASRAPSSGLGNIDGTRIVDGVLSSSSSSTSSSTTTTSSTGGGSSTNSVFSSKFGGNALPAELKYGSVVSNQDLQNDYNIQEQVNNDEFDDDDDDNIHVPIIVNGGGIKRRGVEFVKVENPTLAKDGNIYEKLKEQKKKLSQSTKDKIISFVSSLIAKGMQSRSGGRYKKRSSYKSKDGIYNGDHKLFDKERSVLYHLQKASEYGNRDAQNMIANSLASGILPIRNDPAIRKYLNITLDITSDFASLPSSNGDNQLSRAILLWHMSAMEGNIESLMSLAYRHYVSATSKSTKTQQVLVHDRDLKLADLGHTISSNKHTPKHSSQESDHYGVLGTCESALAYYEEAANHIMDELESGPLRGKVTPAQDTHILTEIIQRGSSSALTYNNKPDELDEAIKFMEIRATRQHEPDGSSAYKLATMYHYGLRGVKQDMKIALKYYEICADMHSWECAGQAGKFYMYGMGLEDDERDFKKALRYFKKGMPGGISNCEERFISKNLNTRGSKGDDNNNDLDGDDDDIAEELLSEWIHEKIYQCDHPSVNGMGMLYLLGVPDLVSFKFEFIYIDFCHLSFLDVILIQIRQSNHS